MTTLQSLEDEIKAIPLGSGIEGRRLYHSQMGGKIIEYKAHCLALHELSDHPKKDQIWDFAWEEGHASGLHEVDVWVQRLAELVR